MIVVMIIQICLLMVRMVVMCVLLVEMCIVDMDEVVGYVFVILRGVMLFFVICSVFGVFCGIVQVQLYGLIEGLMSLEWLFSLLMVFFWMRYMWWLVSCMVVCELFVVRLRESIGCGSWVIFVLMLLIGEILLLMIWLNVLFFSMRVLILVGGLMMLMMFVFSVCLLIVNCIWVMVIFVVCSVDWSWVCMWERVVGLSLVVGWVRVIFVICLMIGIVFWVSCIFVGNVVCIVGLSQLFGLFLMSCCVIVVVGFCWWGNQCMFGIRCDQVRLKYCRGYFLKMFGNCCLLIMILFGVLVMCYFLFFICLRVNGMGEGLSVFEQFLELLMLVMRLSSICIFVVLVFLIVLLGMEEVMVLVLMLRLIEILVLGCYVCCSDGVRKLWVVFQLFVVVMFVFRKFLMICFGFVFVMGLDVMGRKLIFCLDLLSLSFMEMLLFVGSFVQVGSRSVVIVRVIMCSDCCLVC